MKKLPIAKTEFKTIIEEGFCYVDKTMFIKELFDDAHGYYFLSRPRRFGKSLFLDTLKEAFSGNKKLFKGLFLEKNWDWTVKYPVVKISLGSGTGSTVEELNSSLHFSLKTICQQYDIEFLKDIPATQFKALIRSLSEKYNKPVVILIDEYDKPILDNLTKPNVEEIRESLAGFYSVLKDSSEYLKFVFLTGVSKFSKTSIFSKLNNITDISLVPKYGNICGYRQEDLENIFADYLHDVDLEKVKKWYNGYNFLADSVYNPYDVLMFLWRKEYEPYWFETGTPTFLLNLLKEKKYFLPKIENVKVSNTQINEFDINNIDLEVLLYQTGYLTIHKTSKAPTGKLFYLKVPNKEVQIGFNDYLLRMLYASGANAGQRTDLGEQIYYSLSDNQPEKLEQAFRSFFAQIPVDWYRNNDIAHFEGFYSSMFYTFFAALGLDIVAEDITNKGKIDLTILMEKGIFIFEFKMKTNPQNALQQIKERKYHEKYISENKAIYLIGIEFDEAEKNISNFELEKIK